jgi:hypothetical protein
MEQSKSNHPPVARKRDMQARYIVQKFYYIEKNKF